MFREIFPPKDPHNPDPEKRIDCGPPTWMEQLTGKQQIAFNIKGSAILDFELVFRLYQSQLVEYVSVLKQEFPGVDFHVRCNRLFVHVDVQELCDTRPLTSQFTPASYIHNQTYVKIRDITSMIDRIYDRVLELHVNKMLKGKALQDETDPEGNLVSGSQCQS
jgi:hypothetical protein